MSQDGKRGGTLGASQGRGKAHKTMTSEEYDVTPIVGWHMVCRDYDGFGGTGVRFIADGDVSDYGPLSKVKT